MTDITIEPTALPLIACTLPDCGFAVCHILLTLLAHVLQVSVTYESQFDSTRIFGCVCDSSWEVGLGDCEVQ